MIRKTEKDILLYGHSISAQLTNTGSGIQILLTGGDRAHIGSVAIAGPDGELTVHTFPGHREEVIAVRWAKAFFQKYRTPVVVSVGIHYDRITPEQIQEVLVSCDRLLEELLWPKYMQV